MVVVEREGPGHHARWHRPWAKDESPTTIIDHLAYLLLVMGDGDAACRCPRAHQEFIRPQKLKQPLLQCPPWFFEFESESDVAFDLKVVRS
jgi:hypothetical protein